MVRVRCDSPLAGASLSVLKDLGVYEGGAFMEWMRGLLEARGKRTFGDLVRRDARTSSSNTATGRR